MSKVNGRLKSVLIFCLKLVVTAVPAYFVYRNIVMACVPKHRDGA